MHQILYTAYFTCGMAQKGAPHLIVWNAAAIVCHADEVNASVPDLYCHGICSCIDSIFHKFFYDRSRALYHLARRDLIDRHLIQYLNMGHINLLSSYHLFFSLF